MIPHPVMMGFVNGLAIVIFLSQLSMFMTSENGEMVWMQGASLWTMIGLGWITMAIMFGLPQLTKKLPEALVAILVVSAIVIFGDLDVATVGSFIRDGGGDGLKGACHFHNGLFLKRSLLILKLKIHRPYALDSCCDWVD